MCYPRVCLKNHSRNLHAPLCGIFHPNSVAVARYGALIRAKYPTNCDAHLAESLFQTRSNAYMLSSETRYLASVIDSPVSMKSITDYLISAGRKVSQNTVSDYVEALTERAGKKSQYVRERIVLTLPVSDRQGIFLPIFRTKNLEKG